jgi:hypothetical protein
VLDADQADPAGWLERSGIVPDARRMATARRWFAHQPAATVQAMARSVVMVTGAAEYLALVCTMFASTPCHLVAGERSREGWDVLAWAMRDCGTIELVAGTEYFMMLEESELLGQPWPGCSRRIQRPRRRPGGGTKEDPHGDPLRGWLAAAPVRPPPA